MPAEPGQINTTAHRARPTVQSPALGRTTARGAAWMIGQAVGSKLVSFGSQIALTALLMPEDFGLVALAYTVRAFTDKLQDPGITAVLVQRSRHFERWMNPAFWMSLSSGVMAMCIMLAAIPLAVWFYGEPGLVGLMLVLALSAPLDTLRTVPRARLSSQMRFGTLAGLDLAMLILQMGLSIALAATGFGAYSFVMPLPVMYAVRTGVLWSLARPRVRWALQLRRWRHLLNDTVFVFATYMARTLYWQGDYIVLGRLHGTDVVGVYFFAFTLSTQTLFLLAGNLSSVLFPALSRLTQEPARQKAGFRQAIDVLAMIGIPMALLQAAVADPVVRLVFTPRWYDGIPVLQVLSVGMAIRMVGALGSSLTQANGRFKLQASVDGCYAVMFLTAVSISALYGAALTVAITVAICSSIFGLVNMYVAMRQVGGGWADAIGPYLRPTLIGGGACAAGWAAAQTVTLENQETVQQLLRLAITLVVSLGVYLPLIRMADRPTWALAMMRFKTLLRRGES